MVTVTRNEKIAQRVFEDRQLVITVKDSVLHRFNEVGTFIWQLLETPKSHEEIAEAVAEHFEGFDPKTGRKELDTFVHTLAEKGMVSVHDGEQG